MTAYRKYVCSACGHVYDEELGDPETGQAPGTRWEDIPDDWLCPECGVDKSFYDPMDIRASLTALVSSFRPEHIDSRAFPV